MFRDVRFLLIRRCKNQFYRHHLKTTQINLYETCIKDKDVPFKCKTVTEHANKVHCGFLTYL
ncbi:hypothetical protein NBO_2g0003 [Nosema bombycis CQ1]|uniref:Uncharacterized protein n=1 Tax=Nosema bombycis (strain CQ1 / CVCC 102059) TaxID=578461 RepID=R0KX90_NOSB1|nr:hypothetical protein NBO_2g0003 [Nosema bombycis CQ1]|eukprot:EOB15511.1 hypothetical protein NBO_2g0003 [Nosema bombycis CQ1]